MDLPRAAVPNRDEALDIIKECLRGAGVDPEAFDILPGTRCLVEPKLDGSAEYLPCYIAVARSNGMAFMFPALGPYGIHQRHVDKLRKPN